MVRPLVKRRTFKVLRSFWKGGITDYGSHAPAPESLVCCTPMLTGTSKILAQLPYGNCLSVAPKATLADIVLDA